MKVSGPSCLRSFLFCLALSTSTFLVNDMLHDGRTNHFSKTHPSTWQIHLCGLQRIQHKESRQSKSQVQLFVLFPIHNESAYPLHHSSLLISICFRRGHLLRQNYLHQMPPWLIMAGASPQSFSCSIPILQYK